MTRHIPVLLCWSLVLGACGPAPVTQTPNPNPTTVSSDIRPGSKGQRLELVEGEMAIPAGTSAYTVQSANAAQMAILNLLSPPASAQESEAPEDGDEPISDEQIRQLNASVDGVKVTLEIKTITDLADGGRLVTYSLKDVPASDENVIIVFASPRAVFKLKAVVPNLSVGLRRLPRRVTIETTAVAETVEQTPEMPRHLSAEEISEMERTEDVQAVRDLLYAHFVRPDQDQTYDDVVRLKVRTRLAGSLAAKFLSAHALCYRNGTRCAQKPSLPPRLVRALAADLQALISRRTRIRLRLVTATHVATAEERAQLLQLGPLQRRAACLTRRISPCPGL